MKRPISSPVQPRAIVFSAMPQACAIEPCTAASAIRPVWVISSMASGRSRSGQKRALSTITWEVMAPRLLPPIATGAALVRRHQSISTAHSRAAAVKWSSAPRGAEAMNISPP